MTITQFMQNGGAGIIAGLIFGAVMLVIHNRRFRR